MRTYLIVDFLKRLYVFSEVTSGEFIHGVTIPNEIQGIDFTREEMVFGIQEFLDWDESPEEFDVFQIGNYWYTTQHLHEDCIKYDGMEYPVKKFEVTIDNEDDGWVHFYKVAPECLMDAMRKKTNNEYDDFEDDSIEFHVDNEIYHYVEDGAWHLSDEEICAKHLDLPMTLTKETI